VLRSTVKALEIVQRAFFFAIGNPYGFTTALILVSVQIRMMMRLQLTRARSRPAKRLRPMSIIEFRLRQTDRACSPSDRFGHQPIPRMVRSKEAAGFPPPP
jgi:hypothetical protein